MLEVFTLIAAGISVLCIAISGGQNSAYRKQVEFCQSQASEELKLECLKSVKKE